MKKLTTLIILLAAALTAGRAQKTCTFTYDNLHRLTSVVQANGQSVQYCYDELGNRTCKQANADCPISTNVAVTAITETTATVNWQNTGYPPGTVNNFTVELSPDNSTWNPVGMNVAATTYNLTGLTAGTTYYVRITSNCVTGTPVSTAGLSFATLGNGVTAQVGDCLVDEDDTESPIFVNCPNTILTFGNDPDVCGAFVNFSIPVAIDNCTGVVVTHTSGPQPGDFLEVGMYSVTYTATDTAGNTTPCTFQVKVVDTQLPVIACPTFLILENDFGQCGRQVFGIAPKLAFDNCAHEVTWATTGITSTSGTVDASGTSFAVGTTTVTYTISETANPDGNRTATCSFDITIQDTENPTVNTCPADIVQSNDPGTCGTIVNYDMPTFNDNCDGSAIPGNLVTGLLSGSFFPVGVTNILYQYTDAAGNGPVSCAFTVTVNDTELPQIFCDQVTICNVIASDKPLEIWPLDVVTYELNVPTDAVITDVNVLDLAGMHASMGDVTIQLQSPAGTTATLFQQNCTGPSAFVFSVDDAGSGAYVPGVCSITNNFTYFPVSPLAVFNGERSEGVWKLIVTNNYDGECGKIDGFKLQICGNDPTPAGNRLQVQADPFQCSFKMTGTNFNPPFSDNCPNPYIRHNGIMGPFDHTLQGAEFPVGETTIMWTVYDAAGNTATCNLIIEVLDTQPPKFLNCPEPNINQDAEPGICGAYVNFAQPIAVDNCMPMPVVTKTDATGLNSGSVFPVGTSIMNWLATDAHGNTTTCSVKVIVNDTQAPALACPADLTVNTDVWQCDAVVNGIAPASFDDNCDNNLSLVYQIRYPAATDTVIAAGVWNASGEIFPKGMANVDYRVADQPLLLITEVAQSIDTVNGGMMPVPPSFDVVNGDDYLEITNFGPAALDVSCLNIERLGGPAGEKITLPAGTVMQVGRVLTIHFGNGEDNPAGLFFNIKCASDFATFKPSAYVVSYQGVVKDVAALNGFNPAGQGTLATVPASAWSGSTGNVGNKGGIYRKFIFDNNKASDFALADVCHPLTIGTLNPDLDVFLSNGSKTALQSIAPNEKTCSFKVTVQDKEKPSCGEWEQHDYSAATNLGIPNSITGGKVLKSVINVPQNFKVGDIDLINVNGTHPNTDDLIFKLTSPEGTQAVLFGGLCDGQPNFNLSILSDTVPSVTAAGCAPLGQGGQFTPVNAALFKFFGQNSQGNWTLEIADSVGINSGQLNGWTLRLQEIQPYSQTDTTFENDLGDCGALFTWRNARFIDNCRTGTIELKYVTSDGIAVPATPGLINGGEVHTEFFEVGTTTVRYILRDVSGNVDSCEFDVTILDTERPVVVCPADITVQLDGGECRRAVFYAPASATDNCAVVDTLMTPSSGTIFEIGTHTVSIVIFDPAGNTDTCFFNVNIIEHIPTSGVIVCNDLSQVSLDATCAYLLDADAALEGDDYHCYEDYQITITNIFGQNVGNTFTGVHVGQTFTVTVLDPETGNSCWGTLKLEDKLSPTITCPPDITILCTEDEDNLALTGMPQWEDCSAVTTFHTDQFTQYDCAANSLITASFLRKWSARDVWNNTSFCYQTIHQLRGELAQVTFPSDINLPCTAVPNDLSPNISGWPKIGNINLTTTGTGFCGLGISYTDETTHICPGTYKTIRTWKVIDWCTATGNPVSQTHLQYINVNDLPPVVDLTNFVYDTLRQCYQLGVNEVYNGACVATGNLPLAIIDGVCNNIVELEINTPWGAVQNGGSIPAPGLNIGEYLVSYIVRDACGNFMQKDIQVCVDDFDPPVAICDEWTDVSLGLDGTAVADAATFDDGSYDNCEPVQFKVRRMEVNDCDPNTHFDDSVKFCCSDVSDTVQVILRVFDVAVPAGAMTLEAAEIAQHYNDCMVQVVVADKIKPVCTAPANVQVNCDVFDPTLWPYGTVEGSDNCCVDTVLYSVSYTQFDTTCNVGSIRRNWTVKDCSGNTTSCTQTVTVNQSQNYYVRFPKDEIITSCTPGNNYGAPEFYGEDCELLAVSHVDEIFTVVPDACYKIERTWTVINWCNYNSNTACTVVPNPDGETHGKVVVSAPNNGISGWAATNLPVTANGQTVTYNYALANGGTANAAFAGFGGWRADANCYQYKQIIKIIDNAAPIVVSTAAADSCDYTTNDAALWHDMSWWDGAIESHDLCEGAVNLSLTATDACAGENVKVHYQLYLDMDRDGVMETVVPGSVQAPALYGSVRYNNYQNPNFDGGEVRSFVSAPLVANNFGFGLQTQATGDTLTATVRFVNTANVVQNTAVQLPYGIHKIKWIIEDGCGNEKVHETTFTVDDCKKPTVVCTNGLSVNLMNGTMNTVTLWASDAYEYANDNCTPDDLVKITVVRADADNGSLPTATSVDFSCADLLPGLTFGTVVVNVYAEDAAGNFDFCAMYVQVQDNMNVCGGTGTNASVAGALQTEVVEGVQDAEVELDGSSSAIPILETTFSTTDGNYLFNNTIPIASNATITPTLDADPLNGVNTWDLVLISRHILGLEPLGSPYKLISADANKSGTVTTFDIVELRKLILGTYAQLPNNTSWRFINAHQEFTSDENPFADVIQENIQIANIQGSILDGNFVGAKIGDVDGSAIPNQLVSADDRTTGMLLFDVEDRTVKAGEVFTLTLKAAQAVKGYQFTLNLNGLEALEAVPGEGMTTDNFGVFPGAVTTSADGTPGVFGVTFRATKSGRVSEMLSVSSRITRAMAFDGANRLDVALRFHNGTATTIASQGFELYQNAPNPWISRTVIGFYLPEATEARLTIFDGTGRVLYTAKGDFGKGYNAFPLDRKMVDQVSQLYYKVETATDSDVKQMIQTR